jgi:hypothetical protein
VLLDQEGQVVARLGQAVGDVLGLGVGGGLELQAHGHAVQLLGVEVGAGPGDAQIQALAFRQHAVAGVEIDGAGLARLDRDVDVDQVAARPQRVLDLDVQREQPAVGGLDVQGGDVDRHAVQADVHALPAILELADRTAGAAQAEVGGDQHVDDRLAGAVAASARGLVGAEAGRAVTMVRSPAAYRPFTKVESSSSDG